MYDPRAEWKQAIEILKAKKAEVEGKMSPLVTSGKELKVVDKIQEFLDSEDMALAKELLELKRMNLQLLYIGEIVLCAEGFNAIVSTYGQTRYGLGATDLAFHVIKAARIRSYDSVDQFWKSITDDIKVRISYFVHDIIAAAKRAKEKEAKKK